MLRQTSQNCKSSYTSRLKPEELHLKYTVFKDLESHSLCPSNVLKKVVKVSAVLIFRCLSHRFLHKLRPLNLPPPIIGIPIPLHPVLFQNHYWAPQQSRKVELGRHSGGRCVSASVQIECSKPLSEFFHPLEMICKVYIMTKNLVGLFSLFCRKELAIHRCLELYC